MKREHPEPPPDIPLWARRPMLVWLVLWILLFAAFGTGSSIALCLTGGLYVIFGGCLALDLWGTATHTSQHSLLAARNYGLSRASPGAVRLTGLVFILLGAVALISGIARIGR